VAEPAFHPNAEQRVIELDSRVFSVIRTAGGADSRVLCLINISGDEVDISLDATEAGLRPGRLTDLAGGDPVDAGGGRIGLRLRPYGVCWLKGVSA
jgi:sucrose phosphorylase